MASLIKEHRDRIQYNIRNKPEIRELPKFIDVNMCLGGKFQVNDGIKEYVGGTAYNKLCVWLHELNVCHLRVEIERAMKIVYNGRVASNFTVWYRLNGCGLTNGCKLIESEDDIVNLIEGRDLCERVTVYVLEYWDAGDSNRGGPKKKEGSNIGPKVKVEKYSSPSKSLFESTSPQSSLKPTTVVSPTRKSPTLQQEPAVIYISSKPPPDFPTILCSAPPTTSECFPNPPPSPLQTAATRKHTPTRRKHVASRSKPITSSANPSITKFKTTSNTSKVKTACNTINQLTKSATTKQSKKTVSKKPSTTSNLAHPTSEHSRQKGEKEKEGQNREGKKRVTKTKKGKQVLDEDYDGEPQWSSDSEYSDLEVDFVPSEEDYIADEEELFVQTTPKDISNQLAALKGKKPAAPGKEDTSEFDGVQEHDYDSDELKSIQGSDDEVDPYPTFNPQTDFSKPIQLVKGLKFTDVDVLRKSLRYHAIEKHYNYYYLHNGHNRVTTYCRFKCKCPWDKKHGKIVKCSCSEEYKCHFKVYARRLKGETMMQIKNVNVDHVCGYQDANPKLTSEFLADKYLEFFRSNPCYCLKDLQTQVRLDLGVFIGYYKAWFTRARAKFILYGDAADEYGKVYDYAHALLQYNPRSTCIVKCEGVEQGTPVFQRMYVCLEACKLGFKRGCRPIVGVDGCHLKGQYPGMILVAVGKDGNNNIFPIAWAIVEVENKESWTWFFELLLDDLEFPNGEGLTVISDRQKGLVDAIASKANKAEVRFCVRHIWMNFKLQFSGQAFKDHFWYAARTSNKHTFKVQMENIKKLDEDAYNYLNGIPTKHWARHAFQSSSKSNMLLNNLCETFNSVLREARDKPIVSCLEWIRRYVMKRIFEKYEGVSNQQGRLMPYINKVFAWTAKEAQTCVVLQCSRDEWEVNHIDDKHVVNLREWKCTCYKWELTGIPCPHAFACITKRRENPENYVHAYYTKSTYVEAYKESITGL